MHGSFTAAYLLQKSPTGFGPHAQFCSPLEVPCYLDPIPRVVPLWNCPSVLDPIPGFAPMWPCWPPWGHKLTQGHTSPRACALPH
jgi:hypothetical protein